MPSPCLRCVLVLAAARCVEGTAGEVGSGEYVQAASGGTFVAGAVCQGIDMDSNASSMLLGRHLKIYEVDWPPFATPDPSAARGWRGFNIDMIERASVLLGFTFELHELSMTPSESDWTQALLRAAPTSDLVLSYWARREDRLDAITMLAGHMDMSATLIARLEPRQSTIVDSMLSPFRPFSADLWLLLLAVIMIAGVVDYMLEVRAVRALSHTLLHCPDARR